LEEIKDFVWAENELNKLNAVVQLAHELKRIFYLPACKKACGTSIYFPLPLCINKLIVQMYLFQGSTSHYLIFYLDAALLLLASGYKISWLVVRLWNVRVPDTERHMNNKAW